MHEKMFYFLREGALNRCHLCGQVFKLVRLKDEFSELQDYYSLMFSQLSLFEVAEEDAAMPLHTAFSDRPQPTIQSVPGSHVYVHVNADEADRMLVDPAHRLAKLKEAHERLYAMHMAYREIDRQLESTEYTMPIPYGKDLYESWFNIEMSIRKFDRWFNKIEKFNQRALVDPDNHDRREARMLSRKKDRWTNYYTYFLGDLTEEEQMYRDYFETDLEIDPEDEAFSVEHDKQVLASTGDFAHSRFDFIEVGLNHEPHENFQDIVEHKVFKYKYRQYNDNEETFIRRNGRMIERFLERAHHRDKSIEANLFDLL